MVTIKDIAQAVGLSPSTVSIVLGGKAEKRKISRETQKKIFDAATELGYQANIAARTLRGRTGTEELHIAMLWAEDFRAGIMVRFWDGLRDELSCLDKKVQLSILPYTNDHLADVESLTRTSEFHAAIICNASYQDILFLQSTQLAIPVVLYHRTCEGYSSVDVDDAYMGALAARVFSAQGLHTAAVVTGDPVFAGMETRVEGFRLESSRHGLEVLSILHCGNAIDDGYMIIRQYLQGDWASVHPDALFCGSSAIAHGAIRAFWEAGLMPAQQPKIIAIGNGTRKEDCYSIPSLSVVDLPMEEMAAECLHILLALIANPQLPPCTKLLPTHYIARESCGPLPH